MFKFHDLLEAHAEELAELVTKENGKNKGEAHASVAKGNETVEWACSLPQLAQGKTLQVSRGVTCQDLREPVGIVASIVPFNFPSAFWFNAWICWRLFFGITCHPRNSSQHHPQKSNPVMVPCWTFPIALTAGNCVILKPSEKARTPSIRLIAPVDRDEKQN